MPSRPKMTGWYDPVRLISIVIRVAEATVFGKMFDRRELIAALDPFDRSAVTDTERARWRTHSAAERDRFIESLNRKK